MRWDYAPAWHQPSISWTQGNTGFFIIIIVVVVVVIVINIVIIIVVDVINLIFKIVEIHLVIFLKDISNWSYYILATQFPQLFLYIFISF